MNVMYTAEANVTGEGRKGSGRTNDDRLNVDLSVPKGMGGDDGPGTNPEQLFAVGYGACFHGALRKVAGQSKTSVEGSRVDTRVSLGSGEDGLDLAVELNVTIPGVEQAEAERLVEAAHQVCPYSRATRGNIDVTLNAIAA
ncbi:organic hydroperoxide resistance protein [Halostreptopolyspora alba]|uniref:Organic hydroperoxide resistance protein n=1 Tax=Halostreptopolyspora alba TaxID=2487137 RepID=A0A3N0E1T8_9ACTN|nr:organic hydroperoxide resistance protein [Nocardiopsaceae bacterium YIM 96095]